MTGSESQMREAADTKSSESMFSKEDCLRASQEIERLCSESGIYDCCRHIDYRQEYVQQLIRKYGKENAAVVRNNEAQSIVPEDVAQVDPIGILLDEKKHPSRKYRLLFVDLTDHGIRRKVKKYLYAFNYGARVCDLSDPGTIKRARKAARGGGVLHLSTFDVAKDAQDYARGSFGGATESDALKSLISDYLIMRDFKNVRKYADLYVQKGYDTNGSIGTLVGAVFHELDIWKEIAERKNLCHIAVQWVDNVPYDGLKDMPSLESYMREGIFFENMYALTHYTTPAFRTYFTGKKMIDDRIFDMQPEDWANSRLYQDLQQHGYAFRYLGPMKPGNIFDEPGKGWEKDYFEIFGKTRGKIPSTLMQYEFLKALVLAEKPTFFIIHNLPETHPPYANPEETEIKEIPERFLKENNDKRTDARVSWLRFRSRRYEDEELSFFRTYYPAGLQVITLSDHGALMEPGSLNVDHMHHTIFAVNGVGIRRTIGHMASSLDFVQIVEELLDGQLDQIGTEHREDYCLLQAEDPYDLDKETVLLSIRRHPKDIPWAMMQYRGVITQKDWYIRAVTGQEIYVLRSDVSRNLIGNAEYNARISELRGLAGNVYINSWKEPKYQKGMEAFRELGIRFPDENTYV